MRKLILILSTTALMFSCSSVLDEKVSIANYEESIKQIKAKSTGYSDADFNKAGENMGKSIFASAMDGGKSEFKKTYRELLDEAKYENEKLETRRKEKEERYKEIREIFEVNVTNGEYFHDTGEYSYYPNKYNYTLELKNISKEVISAFKGRIVFKNNEGEVLLTKYIDEAIDFPAGETAMANESSIISIDDNLTELKALPFDKITTIWEPELLIFSDGSRMKALD